MAKRKMIRFIPDNHKLIELKDEKYIIYTYEKNEKFIALCYGGKRSKPSYHYNFKSEESRQSFLDKNIADKKRMYEEDLEWKRKEKERKEKEFAAVEVGDIFHASWGFEQTQCDFYQLISIKGKTGTFREISYISVEGSQGMDCERRKASKDVFIGEEFKKRIAGNRISMNSYSSASKVQNPDTDDFYCSWYY